MFSLHVRLDDRTLQYLRLFIAFSHTTRDTLRAKAKMSTNSGHRRAVQPTQLRSPSNTDHTTIARQRYLERKDILGTCDPFTAPADICISISITYKLTQKTSTISWKQPGLSPCRFDQPTEQQLSGILLPMSDNFKADILNNLE